MEHLLGSLIKMSEILHLQEDDLRISLFAPLERDTPLVEILYGEKILVDLSFRDDESDGDVVVLFHDEIAGVSLSMKLVQEMLMKACQRLAED